MLKRGKGRMLPMALIVPQNIATLVGRRLSPLRQPASESRGGRNIGQRPLLVEHLFARLGHIAAQDQAIPVRLAILEAPRGAADRLLADLLGDGDAVALDLAVSMVGADRDPEPVGRTDQHRLDLARAVVPQHLDRVGLGQQRRRNAMAKRHRRRRLHADRLQLFDMVI